MIKYIYRSMELDMDVMKDSWKYKVQVNTTMNIIKMLLKKVRILQMLCTNALFMHRNLTD